jgi:hypothetical protein
MPSTTKIMEANKKLAEAFYSLEEFKSLIVGNPDAKIDVFRSKPEEGKVKAPFWFLCGGIKGTVDRALDPMTAPVVRVAQFEDNGEKSYCLVAGLEPVISL